MGAKETDRKKFRHLAATSRLSTLQRRQRQMRASLQAAPRRERARAIHAFHRGAGKSGRAPVHLFPVGAHGKDLHGWYRETGGRRKPGRAIPRLRPPAQPAPVRSVRQCVGASHTPPQCNIGDIRDRVYTHDDERHHQRQSYEQRQIASNRRLPRELADARLVA